MSTLPQKRTKPRRKGAPTPRIKARREENLEHLAMVRKLPCMCCEMLMIFQISKTEAHHIKRKADGSLYGASQKAHDHETIPLCATVHHWNGIHCQPKLSHREFERRYGNERDLLAATLEKLKEF